MKNTLFLVFLFSMLTTSADLFANQNLTDAYVCHDCNYSQAKRLAETKRILPTCHFADLNGGPATIDTPLVCNTTNKSVVILNPQDKVSWKFDVMAHFPIQYHMEVIASNRSMSSVERNNAEIFFNFYDDVMASTNGGLLSVNPSLFNSLQTSSFSDVKSAPLMTTTNDSSNTAACAVAKEYFGNQTSQDNVENFVAQNLATRLRENGQSPYDYNEDIDLTGLGLQVGADSAGFNVSWESDENPVVVTIGDGDTNLVFDVSFKGVIGDRDGVYLVELFFNRTASKIDGRRVSNAFPDGVVNDSGSTTTDDHPCLRDIAERVADNAPWGGASGGGPSNIVSPITQGGLTFCVRTVRARVCSTDRDGQTCTTTEYKFPVTCGA